VFDILGISPRLVGRTTLENHLDGADEVVSLGAECRLEERNGA
jgi:hypothetical protein